MLNIREMIAGGPARLRWVYRYSTCRVRHPESVAEHSWYVSFYALSIGIWLRCQFYGDPNREYPKMDVLLSRAILHDLEEAETGDFPRSLKHASPDIHKMLENVGRERMVALAERMADDELTSQQLYVGWYNAKHNDLEGRIVEFADFLAVLGFLVQEGAGEGNGTIGVHVADMSKYYGKFQKAEFDFLRPLVQQAGSIMQELGLYDSAKCQSGQEGCRSDPKVAG